MVSFYDTQGDVVKIPIWPLFLRKFRVPSLVRKSFQPFEHRHRTISKYKLWYETPILLLIQARTNNGFKYPQKAVFSQLSYNKLASKDDLFEHPQLSIIVRLPHTVKTGIRSISV